MKSCFFFATVVHSFKNYFGAGVGKATLSLLLSDLITQST
jgi:hypothetical protein